MPIKRTREKSVRVFHYHYHYYISVFFVCVWLVDVELMDILYGRMWNCIWEVKIPCTAYMN